ncbi:MAG: hypothetical protein WC718_02835 [Phycisphaerales bacterium]|jgi:mono/diheme cytochrome c family protein
MKHTADIIWVSALVTAAGLAIISGCVGGRPDTFALSATPGGAQPAESGPPGSAGAADGTLELSGSQLWAQNCAQCHNNRSPSDYSDAQWEVAVLHMRVQARLTGEEERKIVQFLKASN